MSTPDDPDRRGLIAWFADNHVAANLLMLLLVLGGFVALSVARVQVFPDIDPRSISVSVPYPGATPYEVEESINRRVEEAINGIEGIKRVRSVASEGSGNVTAELEDNADEREVLDDIKSAVERITDFPPEDAEDANIAAAKVRSNVISVAISGDVSERTLRAAAQRVRDDLAAKAGVTVVNIAGARRYEVGIEVSESALRKYGLTLREVADTVSRFSVNLGGGLIRTTGGEILLRADGQAYIGSDFEQIVLRRNPDGTQIRVADVATVVDGFEDVELENRFNGVPAVFVNVLRVGDQSALAIEKSVMDYVATSPLPEGLSLQLWNNSADSLRSRLNLLLRNAVLGLVLVFGCLVLFLDLRVAFWTTMGIPIAFLGAFLFLPVSDVSINMLSLFGLIVVLGVVVDDAIVVGESVYQERQSGSPPLQAAVRGARAVSTPVAIGVITSIAAFAPLLWTSGTIGQIVFPIPVVVIAVLFISLVESLLVLPSHLSSGHTEPRRGLLTTVQSVFRRGLDGMIASVYLPILRTALRFRYVSVASAVSLLILLGGLIAGGRLQFTFFTPIDSDSMTAQLTMPQGTPAEITRRAIDRIESAAVTARDEFDGQTPDDADSIFVNMSATLGARPFAAGGPGAQADTSSGANIGEVRVELSSGETRGFSSEAIESRWRELVGEIPGATALSFRSSALSTGDDVNVELAHSDFEVLLASVDAVKAALKRIPGASDIQDSFEVGKRELRLGLTPLGVSSGMTLEQLARQVRQAFYGAESQRVQRGSDNLKVLVRFPESERRSLADIYAMRVRLPDGTEVPFRSVADVTEARGYATIERTDRRRVVSVSAKVDEAVGNATAANARLRDEIMPQIAGSYPGLAYTFEGEEKERQESMVSLLRNFGVALVLIVGLLGVQLRSYVQPLIIVSVIPFGLIGAGVGHLAMGYPLSFLSMFGLVALTGVVVNDSLILVDFVNTQRANGMSLHESVIHAARTRFRPIIFTTLTTFLGLAPLLTEKSVQAQFLIPMAISLAYGLVFATAITLVLVPCLCRVYDDVLGLFGARSLSAPVEDAAEPA